MKWHQRPADDSGKTIGPAVAGPMTHMKRTVGACSWMISAYLLLSAISTALAQSDATFARANDEYAKGKFQDAIRDYESLVQAKQWSAPLFYDLGNAYFRAGDLGRSILNYERALALDPQHPESVANLGLAREEARALELQGGRFDALLRRLTTNQVTIIAAVAFWIGVAGLTAMFLALRRSTLAMVVTALAFAVTLLSVFVAYRLETTRRAIAIVTAPELQARVATADNAGSVLQLPPGSEVQVLSWRGDWVYALLPNSLRGWLPTSSVESVRL